jgi:predicted ArsR family transcriptional regulator
MDLFDRRILAVLEDGKPRKFKEILREIEVSHNTLRHHLTNLEHQGFVLKTKKPQKGPGRPKFTYRVPSRVKRQVTLSLEQPYTTLVTLPFKKLQHLCRFERWILQKI